VEEEIKLYSPTHIISFIGRTHGGEHNTIDYLELPGKLKDNLRDNLYSPVILSILCERYNIHYTYLGTGCIFSSDDPTTSSIGDDEKPDFFGSSYSIVKGFTDRLQHLYSKNTLNLRIRMPIVNFQHDRNFLSKIFKYSKICSMPNSMTVLEDMFPVIMDMIKNKTTGTFNLVNKGLITYTICSRYCACSYCNPTGIQREAKKYTYDRAPGYCVNKWFATLKKQIIW
jgi:hypothetical protein